MLETVIPGLEFMVLSNKEGTTILWKVKTLSEAKTVVIICDLRHFSYLIPSNKYWEIKKRKNRIFLCYSIRMIEKETQSKTWVAEYLPCHFVISYDSSNLNMSLTILLIFINTWTSRVFVNWTIRLNMMNTLYISIIEIKLIIIFFQKNFLSTSTSMVVWFS